MRLWKFSMAYLLVAPNAFTYDNHLSYVNIIIGELTQRDAAADVEQDNLHPGNKHSNS